MRKRIKIKIRKSIFIVNKFNFDAIKISKSRFLFAMINFSESVVRIECPEVVAVKEVSLAVTTFTIFSFVISRAGERKPEELRWCHSICSDYELVTTIREPFLIIFKGNVEIVEIDEVFDVVIN